MFEKLVAVDPIGMNDEGERRLQDLAKEVVMFRDVPPDEAETLRRIDDADALLVSFRTPIRRNVLERCPNLRYVGMCCSLYSEDSANVDIAAARERGIVVKGIRDYGDNGVVEYCIYELVRLLHGFGAYQWKEQPHELTGEKVGIIGMGTTGAMVGKALQYLGAEVSYYSRTRKPEIEASGIAYRPLHALLHHCDILSAHLNKNVILLHEEEFAVMGHGKILMNTAIGPCFDEAPFLAWMQHGDNYYLCDATAIPDNQAYMRQIPRVLCANKGAGASVQCTVRLVQKVLGNMEDYLQGR